MEELKLNYCCTGRCYNEVLGHNHLSSAFHVCVSWAVHWLPGNSELTMTHDTVFEFSFFAILCWLENITLPLPPPPFSLSPLSLSLVLHPWLLLKTALKCSVFLNSNGSDQRLWTLSLLASCWLKPESCKMLC